MLQTLREVREREYRKLWGRMPATVGIALWMVEVAVLRFGIGIWTGIVTLALLLLLTRLLPPTSRLVLLLLDLAYSTVMRSNALRILWLVLVADLWLVQGEGLWAIPKVFLMFVAALILPFAMGRTLDRVPALRNRP